MTITNGASVINGTPVEDQLTVEYSNELIQKIESVTVSGFDGDDILVGGTTYDWTQHSTIIRIVDNPMPLNFFEGLVRLIAGEPTSRTIQEHKTEVFTELSNDILNGGNGNDILIDHRGSGILDGGQGNDDFYVTANTDDATKTLIGGSGKDRFFVDIKGDVTLGLNFNAQQLADFVNNITLPDEDLRKAELYSGLALSMLGELDKTGVFSATIDAGVGYLFDSAQIAAQYKAAEENVQEYGDESWGKITQTNRDLIKIEDFTIGEDSIHLPSISKNSDYQYQAVIGAGGTFINVKIGAANPTGVLFIKNTYQDTEYALDDSQFTALVADLLNPKTGVIGSLKRTTVTGFGKTISGTFASEHIDGERSGQTIVGHYGNDIILGNGGDDTIYGGTKNLRGKSAEGAIAKRYTHDGFDVLAGGTGKDNLYGETGDDILIGGEGNDVMVGGPGADIFVFSSKSRKEGVDRIKDFNASEGDVIHIKQDGFGTKSLKLFGFKQSTGALSFDGQQFATLENISSNKDFNLSKHVIIVSESNPGI